MTNPDEPRFPVEVQLVGEDGNAFAIMGRVTDALRSAGASGAELDEFRKEAMSGNYDELLATCTRWVEVS